MRSGWRPGFLILLGMTLGGCAAQQNTQPEKRVDALEVERLASAAYEREDWTEAEQRYAELTRVMPGEVEPWFRLGNIYARTKREELAVRAYRESLVRDPGSAKAWHNMGIVQLRQAAQSFAELHSVAPPESAFHARSGALLDGVRRLLENK